MITERQEAIHRYLCEYQRAHGVPPSSRAIQREFGFSSQTTVVRHLRRLAENQLVRQHADGRWVAIACPNTERAVIPLFGSIPAGIPETNDQIVGEFVAIEPSVFGARGKVWAVRVTGDSMVGEHIADGDIAIFEVRPPQHGDIVAALVDETTTTLKRLVNVDGRILLRSANPNYADIVPRTLVCQGILIGVVRTIRPAR